MNKICSISILRAYQYLGIPINRRKDIKGDQICIPLAPLYRRLKWAIVTMSRPSFVRHPWDCLTKKHPSVH